MLQIEKGSTPMKSTHPQHQLPIWINLIAKVVFVLGFWVLHAFAI